MRSYLLNLAAFLCFAAAFANTAQARHSHHFNHSAHTSLSTDSISPDSVIQFAEGLLGTPYRPASSDPDYGFDCSGFVSYVFKNFNFNVPRSSREFATIGEKISLEDAKPGDIILFTGTKRHTRRIGHVGIVYCNDCGELKFIHATSGKEYCVTITTMDKIYKRRFVQIIRLLRKNDT